MAAQPSTALLRSQDLEQVSLKYKEAAQSKQGMKTHHNKRSSHSSKSSADEIARLKETIAQLQSERQTLQNTKEGGFDSISDLRWRLNKSEKEKLELVTKYNEEVARYEGQVAKLRAVLERGEAQRQNLEYEIALARKDAGMEKSSAEETVANIHRKNEQLKVENAELQQRVLDLEKALHITQQAREEDQGAFHCELEERDRLLQSANIETELLTAEKKRLEDLLQEQDDTLRELHKRLSQLQREHEKNAETLRRQGSDLEYSAEREERLKKELEAAQQKVKSLEENVESERAAHLESKFNSEIIQLRIRDLEAALQVEKSSQSEALSSLELMKQQFREVEKAYEREKAKAKELLDKLLQFEKEYLSTKSQLNEDLEVKKKVITDLSEKVQQHEKLLADSQDEVEKAMNRQAFLEEAYESCMRELEQLLHHCSVSGLRTAVEPRDQGKQSPSALLESLKRTLVYYQDTLNQTAEELEDTKKANKRMAHDCTSYEEVINTQKKNIEEAYTNLASANEEISRLRSECANRETLVVKSQTELQDVQHHWETEKMRAMEAEKEIQKLTQVYQQDSQEKLTFLHDLYQRLVAGCVLIKQPQGLLGRFSWPELCSILQEHTDALTSDLSRANEKISHLECVCQNKSEVVKELQQTQENTFSKLADQVRERETAWKKQKKDLEQHYTTLIGEVHARAQKWQRVAEENEEKVAGMEKIRDQMALDLAHFQKLMHQMQRESDTLLAACALLAGALYPLFWQLCALSSQKNLLLEQVDASEAFKSEIQTLVLALTAENETQLPTEGKRKQAKRLVCVFRKTVIAVIAANRFQKFGQDSRHLFTWVQGFNSFPALAVCAGGAKSAARSSGQEKEERRRSQALRWLTSRDLLTIVLSCVGDLQDMVSKTDASLPSSGPLVLAAAQNSFGKLMEKLGVEMEGSAGVSGRLTWYGDKGALTRRLGHGLHRLNAQMLKAGLPEAVTNKQMVAVLQHHILEFTQRLHAAEVERRSLRMELAQFKRTVKDMKREADKTLGWKDLKQTAGVPLERFESVCQELNSALQREQQAQALLHEQAQQLQDLGLRLELHSGEEAEKDQTLAEAVKSLSEAKMELRRKDQSLRQLGKHLSQLEQDKRQLEESVRDAESALRMAAKGKDSLAGYMKSVAGSLKQVKERISLSWAAATRDDFTLQVPRVQQDITGSERLMGGPEVAACQSFISSFMDLYQMACSKMAMLESEISSHKNHIAALKAELQHACLRENQDFLPMSGTTVGSSLSPHLAVPPEKLQEPEFLALQPEADTSHSLLRENSGNSRACYHNSSSGPLRSSKGVKLPVRNGSQSSTSGARLK
nr:PREDICTED: coiled-coil domain-containing protein 171 [Lepisosteus oculatus]